MWWHHRASPRGREITSRPIGATFAWPVCIGWEADGDRGADPGARGGAGRRQATFDAVRRNKLLLFQFA